MTEATTLGRIGLVGLIAAAAIGTAWLMLPDVFPRFGPRPGTEGAPVAAAPTGTLPSSSGMLPLPTEIAPLIRLPEAPRFQIARVGARGSLVTAGSAAPGAEVQLL